MRNFSDRKAETKAVKAALAKAGINARVTHGNGTAWGWIKVNVGEGQQFGEHNPTDEWGRFCGFPESCPRCVNIKAIRQEALRVTMEVTGRHGEYHGNTQILAQDHWSDAKLRKTGNGKTPIEHPDWTTVVA